MELHDRIYCVGRAAWLDLKFREKVTLRTFALVNRGLEVVGTVGLDRLISFMVVKDLNAFTKIYRKCLPIIRMNQEPMQQMLQPLSKTVQQPYKVYQGFLQKLLRMDKQFFGVFQRQICQIGRKQLVRKHICQQLNFSAKMDSKMLVENIDTLNKALLSDIKAHYRRPDDKPYPSDDSAVIEDVSEFLDHLGMVNPIDKVYITHEPLAGLPVLLLWCCLRELNYLEWNHKINCLIRTEQAIKANMPLDGAPFIVGCLTILKQFHVDYTHQFVKLLSQYVRSLIAFESAQKKPKVPLDASKALHMLEEFTTFGQTTRKDVEDNLPPYQLAKYPQW